MLEILYIPQSFWTGTLPSDGLVSYPESSLGVSYSSAKMQLAYSMAIADCAALA